MATHATVRADPQWLRQLVENLLQNAVEHGGDTVTVDALGDGFFVEDDGSGITESARDQLFVAGYPRTAGGTGYGLRIMDHIADAHG